MDRGLTNQTDIIDEGIIQLCLYDNSNKSLYWRYIYQYEVLCLDSSKQFEDLDLVKCREEAFKAATSDSQDKDLDNKIWSDAKNCFKQSFSNPKNKSLSSVKILDDHIDTTGYITNFEIIPALLIENYLVRGSMSPISLASSICDSILNPPPSACSSLQEVLSKFDSQGMNPQLSNKNGKENLAEKEAQEENSNSFTFKILFVTVSLLGSICFLAVAVYLAKRLLDKHLPRLITSEIDTNVQNYLRMRNEEENPGKSRIDSDNSVVQV